MTREPPRILVVDDEPDMCWALENILRPAGYAVTTTTRGAEAIQKAQERFFNLALLDIRLPDTEGIELVAPLKEMHPDIAVIVITGYASLETAVRALNEGASVYLTKPLNLDEMLATAREVLEKQRLVMENRRLLQELQRELAERKRVEEERERLIAELQEALANIKILRGLIPICASCKRIRDDEGYWQQVEVYIQDRSEARFSHGLCPDCIKKLYPEYFQDHEYE